MKFGKKSKTLLAFALFVGFALTDFNLHEFIGLYLAGVILIGLGIWFLRKWRDGLEVYRRLRRAIYTIGFLTGISGILLFVKSSEWGFWFMISVLLTLVGLLVFVKRKYRIVEFEGLTEQRQAHTDRVMRAWSFPHYRWLVDIMMRNNPKYARIKNNIAIEEAKRNIGKGRTEIVFEQVWPYAILTIIILFATGILK